MESMWLVYLKQLTKYIHTQTKNVNDSSFYHPNEQNYITQFLTKWHGIIAQIIYHGILTISESSEEL